MEQLAHKVDHIAMFPTGKAIIVIVRHIQAGMPVIVEWAEGHAVMVDLHAVPLRCLPQRTPYFTISKRFIVSPFLRKNGGLPIEGQAAVLRLILCCFRFFLVLSFSQGFLPCALPLDLCCIPTIVTAIFHI